MMPSSFRSIVGALFIAGCLFATIPQDSLASEPSAGDEQQAIALLAARCLECHSAKDRSGGLDLSSSESLGLGSDSGAVWTQEWQESLLWKVIESGDMPPKAKLTAQEKELFKKWIADGAKLPEQPIDRLAISSDYRAGYDWWAFRPLAQTKPSTTIDVLVEQKLDQVGIAPNAAALPRELIRRLFIDLTGLPPTFQQVQAFQAAPAEEAYAALVDQLLDSPAYGERWARHWLDVVRYGESDGFERNFPRLNSWHYRDWVIDAINRDMPYDQFVQMQIAGDQLQPGKEGLAAVSFLVSGVHNTVVGSSDRMKRLALQDELEEKVGTISQTFLGLTAQCARCHEHKYDPISSESYYRLAAAIQGVAHGEIDVQDSQHERQRIELEERRQSLVVNLRELETKALQNLEAKRPVFEPTPGTEPTPVSEQASELQSERAKVTLPIPSYAWNFENLNADKVEVEDSVRGLRSSLQGNRDTLKGAELARGLVLDGQTFWQTDPISQNIGEKTLAAWVTVDPLDQSGGGVISLQTLDGVVFDAVVFAEREPRQWMAGSNGFARSQPFGGELESEGAVHIAIRYRADGTIEAFRNGQRYGQAYRTGFQTYAAGGAQFLFGLRHGPPGGNRHFRGVIHQAVCFDSALSDEQLKWLAEHREARWNLDAAWKTLDPETLAQRDRWKEELRGVDAELDTVRKQAKQKVYSVVSNSAIGPTHVLMRGDIDRLGAAVRAGGISGLGQVAADFGLDDNASDGNRRGALAKWITEANRSLLARVMVNRVWHYHFGSGIVETPNDFGFNGSRPSHPELLDYLSQAFIDSGMRLKALHRMIVLSDVYRRSSTPRADGLAKDAANRFLWRYPIRRLDGESVRDAMLMISGVLRAERGGPGYVDVDYRDVNGTTYYHPKAEEPADCFRRTIYRFSPRCERVSLLDALDCPDPSSTAPKRAMTTTPLQALSLLNSGFVFQMSDALVHRIEAMFANRDDQEPMVRECFRAILQREASEEELSLIHI
jgi:mono/diheme cytochrome c family protein/cytochrome c553